MINSYLPDKIIDIIDSNKHNDTIVDNNKHKDTLSHKSYTIICDEFYNITRKKIISTFIVGMLFEMKTVLSSDRTQNVDLSRIVSHFDNFTDTFTPLEKESNLNLNEPTSCSLKSNTKRIKSQYEIIAKKIKPNSTLLSQKKIKSCGFCSISGHRTTGCSLKKRNWN